MAGVFFGKLKAIGFKFTSDKKYFLYIVASVMAVSYS